MTVETGLVVVLAGVAVGALSALFGVGGGILMVPFMVLALDKGQHLAEGTSLLVIVPTAIAGVAMHRKKGYVSFQHAALLALGGVGGAYAGAAIALRLSASSLQMAFGALMAFTGVRTIRRGIGQLRAERKPGDGSGGNGRDAALTGQKLTE
jgi:uncharacterized membrane protein YfcA